MMAPVVRADVARPQEPFHMSASVQASWTTLAHILMGR